MNNWVFIPDLHKLAIKSLNSRPLYRHTIPSLHGTHATSFLVSLLCTGNEAAMIDKDLKYLGSRAATEDGISNNLDNQLKMENVHCLQLHKM